MTTGQSVLRNFVRFASSLKAWKADRVKDGKVPYYPRRPDHVDPPITPSKLFLVQRVKSFKGNPYWEKNVLTQLGFKETENNLVITKNTPDICNLLWKIKHLVKITPIKLPDKLPTADDLNGTYLHENGTFYVTAKVNPVCYEAREQFDNNPKKLRTEIIKEKLRLKWLEGNFM